MNKTTNREEIPLPIRSEAPGTIMVKPPEDHTLFLPAEELDRLEAEMLPELERLELEAIALPVEDHPLQAKAPAAGADPGEDQKGGKSR